LPDVILYQSYLSDNLKDEAINRPSYGRRIEGKHVLRTLYEPQIVEMI
jgi:hypothetical protein